MFLLIDKPKGITSHDVVDRVRKIAGERRVGHAGTLDPNATGLLIVGVGREYTKNLSRFLKLDKEYEAEICLGEEREGDDSEGEIRDRLQVIGNKLIARKRLSVVLDSFTGRQMQTPPDYSAIKIKGKPAYKYARQGKSISSSLNPRKITIYTIRLLKYKYPVLRIRTKVSSGTYIRALARDIGRKLGCGAYLSNLRRTKIGKYSVMNSVTLGSLEHNGITDGMFFVNDKLIQINSNIKN